MRVLLPLPDGTNQKINRARIQRRWVGQACKTLPKSMTCKKCESWRVQSQGQSKAFMTGRKRRQLLILQSGSQSKVWRLWIGIRLGLLMIECHVRIRRIHSSWTLGTIWNRLYISGPDMKSRGHLSNGPLGKKIKITCILLQHAYGAWDQKQQWWHNILHLKIALRVLKPVVLLYKIFGWTINQFIKEITTTL